MKLILCRECAGIVSLSYEARSCPCGRSQGVYLDDRKAIYAGPCLPLGIDNNSLAVAVREQRGTFGAFVIHSRSPHFRRVDDARESADG